MVCCGRGKGRGVDEVNEAKKGDEIPDLFWVMRVLPGKGAAREIAEKTEETPRPRGAEALGKDGRSMPDGSRSDSGGRE